MTIQEQDRYFLEMAMDEAERAESEGSIPIGAVLVGPDGNSYVTGRNRVHTKHDSTAHAEVDAIRNAGDALIKNGQDRQYTLYTTVEPCVMCTGAIYLSNIKRVVWALDDGNLGGYRMLSESPQYKERFVNIVSVSMPFIDLAKVQRERMIRWGVENGKNNSWPEIDKET
ncbi:nucleoside deaminase [Pseudalkalibacillus sp. Hm43]|uniref:nucleoside deaminase n=1 Tax=Pseudalkalibacillus sp. Hm43 TaxID=3450742 RepID=UPI003F426175